MWRMNRQKARSQKKLYIVVCIYAVSAFIGEKKANQHQYRDSIGVCESQKID